ncbi:hypothetical protein GYH30_004592 [Glycine max]|nr:hypothetical protein GYH30_004592 [Glycine max]
MTKDVIHDHNSIASRLHFPFYFSLPVFLTLSLCLWMCFPSSFAWLFIEKSQKVQANSPKRSKLTQVNFLLSAEGTNSPRKVVACPGELNYLCLKKLD